jgi:hypothetical protein
MFRPCTSPYGIVDSILSDSPTSLVLTSSLDLKLWIHLQLDPSKQPNRAAHSQEQAKPFPIISPHPTHRAKRF